MKYFKKYAQGIDGFTPISDLLPNLASKDEKTIPSPKFQTNKLGITYPTTIPESVNTKLTKPLSNSHYLEQYYKAMLPSTVEGIEHKSFLFPSPIVPEIGGQSKETFTTSKGIKAYLNAISGEETRGDYSLKNKSTGAIGKYQFLPSTAEFYNYNVNELAKSPELQEELMMKHTREGIRYIKNKFGIDIDENNMSPYHAELLGIRHYGGNRGLLNFLNNNQAALNRTYIYKKEPGVKYQSINNYGEKVKQRFIDYKS